MEVSRRGLLAGTAALSAVPLLQARAQTTTKFRLGVLTDLSSSSRDTTGPNSVACTRQAVEEFNPSSHGCEIEVLQADHQGKPDVASSISRQWCDQGVDAIVDVPVSSVALAVAQVVREKDKLMLGGSPTAMSLTDDQCSPNTIIWSFDTYMMAQSQGSAIVKAGGKSWYFIAADYAFGHSLTELTISLVKQAGGVVKGVVYYPYPDTADFSSFLQQAQASGAEVLALATAGNDTSTCIKQAHEFGLNKSMRIAPMQMFLNDVHALGLEMAAGLYCTDSFYWNRDDRTRAFTRRVLPKLSQDTYPNMAHASCYGVTLHYLKTIAAMGPATAKQSGRATIARMKAIATDDDAFGPGRVRIDGRGEFPAYLWRVKQPSESRSPYDLLDLIAVVPVAEVLHPLNPKCNFAS